MFVLLTYDVSADRTEKFRKLMCRYLVHKQASVFSGEITQSNLMLLHSDLRKLIVPQDKVLQIKAPNRHNVGVSLLTKGRTGKVEEVPHDHHVSSSSVV